MSQPILAIHSPHTSPQKRLEEKEVTPTSRPIKNTNEFFLLKNPQKKFFPNPENYSQRLCCTHSQQPEPGEAQLEPRFNTTRF